MSSNEPSTTVVICSNGVPGDCASNPLIAMVSQRACCRSYSDQSHWYFGDLQGGPGTGLEWLQQQTYLYLFIIIPNFSSRNNQE